MSIISAALATKLADFAVRVGVSLALRFHRGPCHELAEKYRLEIALAEKQKTEKEGAK